VTPAKNVAELIALAKAQPGKITIASAGNGTLNHLIGEMIGKAAGIELLHVPYKGASGAVNEKRRAVPPEAPTIGETIKGFGSTRWYGLLAPAGTEPHKSTPEQFAALIKDDLPKWAKIVKDSGATVD